MNWNGNEMAKQLYIVINIKQVREKRVGCTKKKELSSLLSFAPPMVGHVSVWIILSQEWGLCVLVFVYETTLPGLLNTQDKGNELDLYDKKWLN